MNAREELMTATEMRLVQMKQEHLRAPATADIVVMAPYAKVKTSYYFQFISL